jgi:UDP:flavonoid glycosyltransferase YjiC (YdhE family)
MSPKKFLLVPGNNSLSHVAKCLAAREALIARGHEARLAVSRKHSPFLQKLSIDHAVLPDIQENDESGFPSVEWFRDPKCIIDCVNAEVSLLKEYKPDRVLGVFRFTLKASAKIAGVPYDSLICGCMIPGSDEVLGFADGEPGRDVQRIILDGFFRYAGSKLGGALTALGLEKSNGDIRHSLLGERTFLWDFPEFTPLPRKPDIVHIGPLSWNRWPYDPVDMEALINGGSPLAVVAFGTCTVCLSSAERIIRVLLDLGYRVLLAAGGRKEFLNFMPHDPRVIIHTFAPLHEILPHASLLITHGGQLTVFEALQNRVPVVVMPFQPEQAHNGVCLERLGCGVRLVPPHQFQGNSRVYSDALDRMTDDDIRSKINSLVQNPLTATRLAAVREVIGRYGGVEKLAASLEEF